MSRGEVSFQEVLRTSRPLWWVTMSVPFIVGALLADQQISWLLILGALYFAFPYNLLVYGVNDIFDYESDMRNERKKSAVHGAVLAKIKHPSLWRWILGVNAPLLAILFFAGNIESSFFLLMVVFMAFAYSVSGLRYKEIPFIDSFTSAFHYTSPFLFGLFLFEGPDLWVPAFASFYLWAVGNHAFGAIQDIKPDKEAGIRSIATQLGASKTLIFCVIMYSLAILAPVLSFGAIGLVAAAAIAPYFLVILSTFSQRRQPNSKRFRSAWNSFIYLNYVVGAIGSLVLIYLYNK